MKPKLIALLLVPAFVLLGCASSGNPPAARGQLIQIKYAEVTSVTRVQMPSAAPAGAMIGGFTGLVLAGNSSRTNQVASGIGGAALGALATSALEGDRRGYSYRIRYNGGGEAQFITDKGYLRTGDCVSVEQGEYSNIRRVASLLCDGNPTAAIEPTHIRDAEQCSAAKDQLLEASTEEEINSAARKVSVLCQ